MSNPRESSTFIDFFIDYDGDDDDDDDDDDANDANDSLPVVFVAPGKAQEIQDIVLPCASAHIH